MFNVIPIKAGAKFPPLISGWQTKAKPREQWGDGYNNCNWAVSCSGLAVIDVDVRNNGLDSLAFLEMIYDFPETYTVKTPTGGLHLYYRLPRGHPGVPNSAGLLSPGLDIKSTGGYVVAAGSRISDALYVANDAPMVEAPDWLVLKLGTASGTPKESPLDVPDADKSIVLRAREWIMSRPKGDEAYATACGLRDLGLSKHQALELMVNHDGRSLHILEEKIRHAYQYARGEPGAKVATIDDFPLIEPVPKPKRGKGPQRLQELAGGVDAGRGYLVKGLLQRGSHAVLYGPPGGGKTFVALDLAYHVAAGLSWMGRKVHSGSVLYLAYEGTGGLAKRAAALQRKYGTADVPLYVETADYNLRVPEGRKSLGETLAALPETPVFIILDTLARAMKGGDENSAQDMGSLNDAVSALVEKTGACVLLLHHTGKNKANGARGSSALLGAIDTELECDERAIVATKQRDVELCEPIGFALVPVMVGIDEDGDTIDSCYVDPRDIPISGPKLRKAGRALWEWLHERKLLSGIKIDTKEWKPDKSVKNGRNELRAAAVPGLHWEGMIVWYELEDTS